jgi:hypothetical protein
MKALLQTVNGRLNRWLITCLMGHQRLARKQSVECNYSLNLEIQSSTKGFTNKLSIFLGGIVADDIQSIPMNALACNLNNLLNAS